VQGAVVRRDGGQGTPTGGALAVEVEEAFAHCQKAFLRSQLWRPETWRPEAVAPFAEKIRETPWRDPSLEHVEAYYWP
jgi:predicted pyridoxine 5'-phosphate oxidase superfamily flavin-nucleotide-binding protein